MDGRGERGEVSVATNVRSFKKADFSPKGSSGEKVEELKGKKEMGKCRKKLRLRKRDERG